jgi:hypothetical protein
MVNKSVLDAFMSTDPRIVELRRKMFRQDGLLPQEGQATVPGTRQPSRYPVDDIEQQTLCTLQMPFNRARKKKEVAQGVALPPKPDAMFNGMPIPPDYDKVTIAWICPGFEQEEIDFPTESRETLLGATITLEVLWNKADLILEAPTPASQPSLPSSSPAGDPDDDDDDSYGGDDRGGNDNDNIGGPSIPTPTNLSVGNNNP